jgi:GcrA cell cycle regulator
MKQMQSADWAAEHTDLLREYLAKGISFSRIADAINTKFNTTYSRSAAIGRARRLGLASPKRRKNPARRCPKLPPKAKAPRPRKSRERYVSVRPRPTALVERAGRVTLRCVEIVPRHLSLFDLEDGDCRYPFGGNDDGEAITFCGHPCRSSSSYCVAHFHLTRGPDAPSEPAAAPVSLRLVDAA